MLSCSCDVSQDTQTTKRKGRARQYRGAEEVYDEPVTVVCSRYEREREPLSLNRTCQELAERILRRGFWEIEVDKIVFGVFLE